LQLVKSGEIKLHPKNEFISNLKICGDDIKNRKTILSQLRQLLYEQVINIHYDEIDVYLISTIYISKLIEDIYILAMTLIEEQLIEGIDNIIIKVDEDEIIDDENSNENEDYEESSISFHENSKQGANYLIGELTKIIKHNCDSIKNEFKSQIGELKQKGIEQDKKISHLEVTFREELKKLNDRVNTLESKIKKTKTKFINVISNEILSTEESPVGTSNRTNERNDRNNEENPIDKKRYDTWIKVNNKKNMILKKRITKNNIKKENENKFNVYSDSKNSLEFLSKAKQPILIGKNKTMQIKGIPQRLHIYTSRWPENTTTQMVVDHVNCITNRASSIIVEQIPLQYGTMKAFKVIAPFEYYNTIYNSDNWPDNVLVKRFGYSKKINYSLNKNNNTKESQNDENIMDTLNNENEEHEEAISVEAIAVNSNTGTN
jgi:hypothetical protein